jgi:hypothetical protein
MFLKIPIKTLLAVEEDGTNLVEEGLGHEGMKKSLAIFSIK